MEKSIVSIWNKGFLKSDALVAPKLNDLYNQKSIDIVEKFKRMYRLNVNGLVVFTAVFLPVTYFVQIPYMGIMLSVVFLSTAYAGSKFQKKLNAIDKTSDTYQYLQSFDKWTKEIVRWNEKRSRYMFSYVFISMVVGFWFGSIGGDIPGQDLMTELLRRYPDLAQVFGVPLVALLGAILIVILLSVFGPRIGKLDLNIVYGPILQRLERLLIEMEQLRA